MRENDLNGSIPKSLGNCKNLQLLNFSHNSLDGTIPTELLKIDSLSEGLDLSHNKLSGVIPQEIGVLINLGVLNISNNRLSGQNSFRTWSVYCVGVPSSGGQSS